MLLAKLALIAAAFYTGFALYIVLVEHPARMKLDNQSLLMEWKESYGRGHVIGPLTVVITALLGLITFFFNHEWLWAIGSLSILINVPYTIIFINPTNHKLLGTTPETANDETRSLVQKWTNLHIGRCIYSTITVILFLLAP